MTKVELVEHTRTKEMWPSSEIRGLIAGLSEFSKPKIADVRIGDIYRHRALKHPAVVISIKKGIIQASIITTEDTCVGIVMPTNSRFVQGYFTSTIVQSTQEHVIESFMGCYSTLKDITRYRKLIKIHYSKL